MRGPFFHYIVVYGQDANNVYTANPWGARDIAYPLAQFNGAYIAGVVIPIAANTAHATPAPVPASAPQPAVVANGVNDLTTDQATKLDFAFRASSDLYPVVVAGQTAIPVMQAQIATLIAQVAALTALVTQLSATVTTVTGAEAKDVATLRAESAAAIAAAVGEAEQTAAQMLTKPAPNPTKSGPA